ncbi:MAG: TetR/AcrR family transcriptional regulator, partial [Devosiaceae bacterium]|nr:TetR/AcrR family transcriptional regulator [Devosiaceae bacterium]
MTAGFIQSNSALNISRFTPRQGEVLDAALGLLVKVGDKLTMNEVAKAASCSKETLYNWFGDREGLLISIVQWQASKVVMPEVDFSRIDRVGVIRGLEIFGTNLLQVLTSDTSVALNRVAVAR